MIGTRFFYHRFQISRFDFHPRQHAGDQIDQHLASCRWSFRHLIL